MRPTTHIRSAFSGASRLLGVAALLVFVSAFFALPLWAAASLCTMPCCHHGNSSGTAVNGDMQPCQPQCVVTADDAESAATFVVPANDGSRVAVTAPAVVVAMQSAQSAPAAHAPDIVCAAHPAAAPLNVLNSTFRI